MQLFSCRDSALGQFLNPFAAPATGMAVRSFSDEVNNPQSPLHAHPEDYELYHVGDFDPESGVITPQVPPNSLARAKDLIVKKAA